MQKGVGIELNFLCVYVCIYCFVLIADDRKRLLEYEEKIQKLKSKVVTTLTANLTRFHFRLML